MNNVPAWFMAGILILAVLGLLLWARGPEHHRGDDEGALGVRTSISRVLDR